jgi:3-methyl-2-oxobutanoate hydroxymethyltransferase
MLKNPANNPLDSKAKVTIFDLQSKKDEGIPITMLTAYDYSSGLYVDRSGVDVILVGDSLAMVMLGISSTIPITMEQMLHHCRAVARGASRSFLVGDMPFMSYQADISEAVHNAGRFLKEGEMESVKLEGGQEVSKTIEAIVSAGISVMGHIGLTPQSISKLGGYKVQGKTAGAATRLLQDAMSLEEAGCYSIVLEAVPAPVAEIISNRLHIPTIGIGAGVGCDGQVLVYHDLLGLFDRFTPKFVKKYANLAPIISEAISEFVSDVENKSFPAEEHTYPISDDELQAFTESLSQ